MGDLNDRLEDANMPIREYGNAATMFKKTVPEFSNIGSITNVKDNKAASVRYEAVKKEFITYDLEFKRKFQVWATEFPSLAAELAERDARVKERRLEQTKRKTVERGGDKRSKKDNVDSDEGKNNDNSDSDSEPSVKKKKSKKEEELPKKAKKRTKYVSEDSDDDRAYRGSYTKLTKVSDGNEMKQMIKMVSAFKEETERINAKVDGFHSKIADCVCVGKEIKKELSTYNQLVDELYSKLDEAAFSIVKRRRKRNLLQDEKGDDV